MVSIDISPRPHEIVEDVWFGEKEAPGSSGPFVFKATESADLLSAMLIEDEERQVLATIRAKIGWLEAGFDPEDWSLIQKRLHDPTDPLRTIHLLHMFNALSAEVSMRPPTSSGGSSSPPPRKTGGGKQKRKAATSGD